MSNNFIVIYIRQPEGFVAPGNENKICLLFKALYDLRQGSKQWFEKLRSILKEFGELKQSILDQCVSYVVNKDLIFIVYFFVDDIFMFHNRPANAEYFIRFLQTKFKLKDLGEAKKCLGITNTKNVDEVWIKLSQEDYILTTLEKYNMIDCTKSDIPLDPGTKLVPTIAKGLTNKQIIEI